MSVRNKSKVTASPKGKLHQTISTNSGAPIPSNEHLLTAGDRGPALLQDYFFIEKIAHFDRERIPERVVHAKGAGAFGYFEVTHEVSKYTKADFLREVGLKTDIFVRFSTVGGEKGSSDFDRDPRGFAIKFYTQEGNYDLVGNNLPVFFIRDPLKFPDMVHTHKRNPQSNLKDANAFWDFNSLSPETVHMLTMLFSDRGTPKTYRNMHGFGVHTFKFVNKKNESFFIKWHLKTDAGIQTYSASEAAHADVDGATRDLFEHIKKGGKATWKVYIQVMPTKEANTYKYNPFDPTKVWLYSDYPLIPVGKLILNRNPENFFQDVEQAAFTPANLVPGIEASPDKLLQGRIFSYADTQRHRLGPNYALLPVNCPYSKKISNYQRDGAMRIDGNGGSTINYSPNSYGGPRSNPLTTEQPIALVGNSGRTEYPKKDDFVQAGLLYEVFSEEEKKALTSNIAGHMKPVEKEIKVRQLSYFYQANKDYALRIANILGISEKEIKAYMS
ncbi:catalase [Fluviispira multicolorata]|uniref:Catalase n=1 Tax=Fluviispira multicolorata TaxID=2654512 RepID=A0A833JDY1_9BACT|nr:catalase [Fluviispira multicolorata]KAB8032133.1 catalase [Fluviispira multicolorata]